MSADNDLHCEPAPSPATPTESSAQTEIIRSRGMTTTVLVGICLVGVLIAGSAYGFWKLRGSDAAGSVASEVRTASSQQGGTVKGQVPAECVGDVADPQLRWYCQEFLPFAQKAAADHDRLDRLEADGTGSGAPLGLWLIAGAALLLSAFNAVKSFSRKDPPG